ncbi:MAG: heme lyase CcmF/NrfE family subunit [Rhodospirillaceae bacterium]|jgi:cytochrome c-type biogenesis protein CcmF|nr:heme lyase CcmF/NrfE family subunit [Rhodospirillaceae bacterium]
MIAEIGHYALVLAFILAAVQSTVPLWGAARGDRRLTAVAAPAALLQLLLVGIAFLALMQAYIASDFSLANVADNSHSAKPLLYKITGVWANHEGSMVLWVLILALFGAAVAGLGGNLPETLRARVLAIQGMIGTGFLAFILFTSNPFLRVFPPPLDGAGLNPLLQDPGLAFHPPMLYLGYVGFSMAFSFAIAALIEGRVDPAWARWVRPWTLAAWSFLTLGIALGSWWAYYELGWGGWWFWDPVENASFMPWLAGTALLHSAIVVEKRGALKAWTVLLAILAFSLSLMGTFLVRSGVLTSVHAFATDPQRGLFILVLLALTIGGSLALFALRAPRLKGGGVFAPISREGALVLNNLLLTTATLTVFVGTLYPLVLDALGGGKISVGPPYFEATFVPLMIPTLIAVAIGPMLAWKRGDLRTALARLRLAMGAVLIVALGTLALADADTALAALGTGLAAWLIAGAAVEWADRVRLFRMPLAGFLARARHLPRAAWGMTLAHAGLGLLVAGITGSSAWQTERIQVMQPGDAVELAGYEVTLVSVGEADGPNYTAERAQFRVESGGRLVTTLAPEKRFYPVEGRQTTEAAIHTTLLADLYAVIGEADGQGGWTTRIYHNPLVPWIWAGCLVMVAGGAVSLTDRRHRVGAPARPRPSPTPATA